VYLSQDDKLQQALKTLEAALSSSKYLAGSDLTLADVGAALLWLATLHCIQLLTRVGTTGGGSGHATACGGDGSAVS
jgi:glutathione S-transferase